jgi:hypothetical protein
MTAHPRHAFNTVPGRPQPSLLTPVAQFFRRFLAGFRRRLPVPAVAAAGTGTGPLAEPDRFPCCVHCLSGSPCDPADSHPRECDDGCNAPVLGQDMLSEVRARWDIVGRLAKSARLPDAEIADLDARVDYWMRQPRRRPVNGRYLGTLPRRHPGATLPRVEPLVDRGPDHPPWMTGAFPVYGQAPVERVLEAERLAGAMLP